MPSPPNSDPLLATGLGLSPGRRTGELFVDLDLALDAADDGRPVVLALATSTPADTPVLTQAAAVLTTDDGPQSHTAVVARAAGVPAVQVEVAEILATGIRLDGRDVPAGTHLTVDGNSGLVTMAPTVVAIQAAKATRVGMEPRTEAEVETAAGLVGDRYHGSKHRQLSVQSLEELAAAEAAFGHPIDPLITRRNVTISHGMVPRTPGHRWRVGAVELEVVRDAAPCKMLDMEIGDGARTAMRRRAGVICRVVAGATLGLGDPVDLGPDLSPEAAGV